MTDSCAEVLGPNFVSFPPLSLPGMTEDRQIHETNACLCKCGLQACAQLFSSSTQLSTLCLEGCQRLQQGWQEAKLGPISP